MDKTIVPVTFAVDGIASKGATPYADAMARVRQSGIFDAFPNAAYEGKRKCREAAIAGRAAPPPFFRSWRNTTLLKPFIIADAMRKHPDNDYFFYFDIDSWLEGRELPDSDGWDIALSGNTSPGAFMPYTAHVIGIRRSEGSARFISAWMEACKWAIHTGAPVGDHSMMHAAIRAIRTRENHTVPSSDPYGLLTIADLPALDFEKHRLSQVSGVDRAGSVPHVSTMQTQKRMADAASHLLEFRYV